MLRKKRGPNFSSTEKEILIHLITKHKDALENKKTDAVTTRIKNEAWKEVTEEFNSLSPFSTRNTEQLKTCWDNIKQSNRKKAKTKKQTLFTGEGKPVLPLLEPLQNQVEVILGPNVDEMHNDVGSDSQFSNVSESTDDVAAVSIEEKEEKPWNSRFPRALKTKVFKRKHSPSSSSHLQRRSKTPLQDKLLQSKIELVELMKSNVEKEAEMKQYILEEQLKQEKIKTEALQFQLNNFVNN